MNGIIMGSKIRLFIDQYWVLFIALIMVNMALFIIIAKYLFPVLQPSLIVENKEGFEKIGMLRWEDGRNHALPWLLGTKGYKT